MFACDVTNQDRKPSMSSDEEGDIYCHSLPAVGGGNAHIGPSEEAEKTSEKDPEQDSQDKNRPYMVRNKSCMQCCEKRICSFTDFLRSYFFLTINDQIIRLIDPE